MKIFAGLLVTAILYLSFGPPNMAATFVTELRYRLADAYRCKAPLSDRLIQLSDEKLSKPSHYATRGPVHQIAERVQIVLAAAKATAEITFAEKKLKRHDHPHDSLASLSTRLPTFLVPERPDNDSFLTLPEHNDQHQTQMAAGTPPFGQTQQVSTKSHMAETILPRADVSKSVFLGEDFKKSPKPAVRQKEKVSSRGKTPEPAAKLIESEPQKEQLRAAKGTTPATAMKIAPVKQATKAAPKPAASTKAKMADAAPQTAAPATAMKIAPVKQAAKAAPKLAAEAKAKMADAAPQTAAPATAMKIAPLPRTSSKPAKRAAQKSRHATAQTQPVFIGYPDVRINHPFKLVVDGVTVGAQTVVKFTGNGRELIAGSTDGRIRLWDLMSGKILHEFTAHQGRVWAAVVDQNGAIMASSGADGWVKIWDLKTGTERHRFRAHKSITYALALSPDGTTLLTAGGGGDIKKWDVATAKQLLQLKGHKTIIRAMAIAQDSRTAISGGGDNLIKYWDLTTGALISTHKGHIHPVLAVAFAKDATHFISGGGDNALNIWKVGQVTPISTRWGHQKLVRSVAVAKRGDRFVSADGQGLVRLWRRSDFKEIARFDSGGGAVLSSDFSRDGKLLATASQDGAVRIWRVEDQVLLVTLLPFKDGTHVAFRPEGPFAGSREAVRNLKLKIGDTTAPVSNHFMRQFFMEHGLTVMKTAGKTRRTEKSDPALAE